MAAKSHEKYIRYLLVGKQWRVKDGFYMQLDGPSASCRAIYCYCRLNIIFTFRIYVDLLLGGATKNFLTFWCELELSPSTGMPRTVAGSRPLSGSMDFVVEGLAKLRSCIAKYRIRFGRRTWWLKRAEGWRTCPNILIINHEIRTTVIPFYSGVYCSGSPKAGLKTTFMYQNISMVAIWYLKTGMGGNKC
jgi:hypothetical protein